MASNSSDETPQEGMNIERHTDDPVQEAINRAEWKETKLYGEVSGYEILVVARVTDGGVTSDPKPRMTVHFDGEYDREEDIYLSGKRLTRRFDKVWDMDHKVGELQREHDLEVM